MNDIEAAARAAFEKWWKAWEHVGTKKAIAWQTWRAARSVYEPTGAAALAHAARGEGEEAEVHRQLDEATRIVKPYYNATGAFVGGPGNWIAPVHACPKCGKSLNWREFGGGIVADCACGRQTSYLFHPTPPPATGEAGTSGNGARREEIVREVIAGAKVLSATLRSLATMGPKHLAALQLEAALNNYDALLAAEARAMPASRDASNPGEKEER